jgi:hypothetical protein
MKAESPLESSILKRQEEKIAEDDVLICRSKHICTMEEGGRSFSKAFEDRFTVRDIAMMADHNNFMSFDINSEKDALEKV